MSSEPDVSSLISVQRAIEIIDSVPVHPRTVRLSLRQALGTRLARDIFADRDYPPFDKSLMDGFAVCCDDAREPGAKLRIVGEVAAGQWYSRLLERGQTVAIMTGAPLPPGADGVVPIEDVDKSPEGIITVRRATAPGRYIARRGNDTSKNSIVLSAGQLIGPAQIAVAASVGAGMLEVFARPRASVLSTGNELVDIGQTPGPSEIRNSNSATIHGLLTQMGCDVRDLGIAPDNPSDIRDAIAEGMRSDLLFVSGGMSMGEYDYVPKILLELGVKLFITKLKIKPGKPFVFGQAPRRLIPGAMDDRAYADMTHSLPPENTQDLCHVFGLPGNPVSGFVCTARLASRLITRLAGGKPADNLTEARLNHPIPPNGPRETYSPILLAHGQIDVLEWKGSADVFTLARANALMIRPENDPARAAGDMVRVLPI